MAVAAAALLFCARAADGDGHAAVMHFLADGAVGLETPLIRRCDRSVVRSRSRSRGVRLIVLVHCSDGDVMVSAGPQPGTLFYLYFRGAKSLFRSVSQNRNRSVVALAEDGDKNKCIIL